MENTEKPASADAPITPRRDSWWIRLTRYAKHKMDERAAKKQKETPADRAARVTANATLWMAIFTFVSIAVSFGTFWILKSQLREMHDGGVDTHTLAETSKLTIRPRIDIVSVGPYREMVNREINNHLEGGLLRVQVGYINRGPFGAKNVRIFTYDSIGPNAVKGSYHEEPQLFPQIPPSGEQVSNTYFTGRTRYSAAELDALVKGTLRATFSVLIVYDDDLGKETHHAEYCDVFTLQPYNDICPWPVRND